ncbi:MAG: polyribonucleotide nucleotidyltransferase [Acidimicrobiia bacterium]|nr:polyribonucleotide nucleotidyltransferase [Acidimicrobiia bacterium]
MSEHTVSGSVGGKELTLNTGKLALLADGAVVVTMGDTEVLVTATASRGMRPGQDFFPLTVDVEERMYAVGKIPGSFFRREGRATDRATLTCRLIDRPLRPSFRDGYMSETHIVATVLAVDGELDYDVLALNGASAALTISGLPFEGPIGAIRLALKDGNWIANPTYEDLGESVFEIVVAGTRNADGAIDINMVEAGATEEGYRLVAAGQPASNEERVAQGLEEAKAYIAESIDLQLALKAKLGDIPEVELPTIEPYSSEMLEQVKSHVGSAVSEAALIADKKERKDAESKALEGAIEAIGLAEDDMDGRKQAAAAFKSLSKEAMRRRVIDDGIRLDGRKPDEIRELSAEVGLINRTHGTGLFQRGQTQVLSVATLGMLRMEQMLDTIHPEESKRYMHHYNFPHYSTGETGFMRGPKRREIGHGFLAEKALLPVIPNADDFPYAIRVVSDVMTSNGSTSMASVCGSSLSLMDAGVPIAAPVGGIAMGLIAHDDGFITLTDILGAEDALGDMDFKVAGTADMITALQLDTKIAGLPADVLIGALAAAKDARLKVLAAMAEALPAPREELNKNAPRIEAVSIPKDKIGEIIGPKGKMIREIEELTGATLDIEDDGTVIIGAVSGEELEAAKERVLEIAFPPDVELGEVYDGEVVNITKFGAFINLIANRDGLLHISKMGGGRRIENVEDEFTMGDKVKVIVREIDDRGKVSLDLADAPEGGGGGGDSKPAGAGRDSGDRDKGRRNGGGRDRGGNGGGGREAKGGGRDRGGDGGGRDRGGDRGGKGRDRGGDRDSAGRSKATSGKARKQVSFSDEFEAGEN